MKYHVPYCIRHYWIKCGLEKVCNDNFMKVNYHTFKLRENRLKYLIQVSNIVNVLKDLPIKLLEGGINNEKR